MFASGFSITQAVLIALYYWFCWWDFSHPVSGVAWAQDCVWIGVIMGLLFGDVQLGLVIGGTLALTFICALPVGANLPVDYAAAALAAVPMAIRFHWSAGLAICVSVFFGIGGAKLDGLRRTLATRFNNSARRHIRERKYNLLVFDAVISPVVLQFFIRAIPMFIAVYFGGAGLQWLVPRLPQQVLHALEAAGGILPGLGIALCLNTIGRSSVFPFFALGFFAACLMQGSILPYVGLAGCIALIYCKMTQNTQIKPIDRALVAGKLEDSVLTDHEHFMGYARFAFVHRCSQAMDTFYGTGMAYSFKNVLRKIYRDDDAYQAAMERHLEPFIPEVIWGSSILGIVVREEEKNAANAEEELGASISTLKTSLMGPVAGFGDSINYMVFWNMLKMTFYPLAAAGSFLGMLTPVILHPTLEVIGWKAYKAGYRGGTQAIVTFLKSGLKDRLMIGASIFGYFLLGAICFFNVHLPIAIPGVEKSISAVIPQLFPFLTVCGVYCYMRKGGKFLPMMLCTILICIVLSLVGII
ncbi:PTS sugar transporter subunit IIC [Oscillibacter sp. MSJ-2]|uniref:PTS sugar transporter subunit IIC n=1 Tax=Dysosmobacter acutus TaxID=2841504 RepID=A0ABS6F9J3_9FIRM|nr:PTS sugar transporter subunit IIC [Dysosmobacter acutus]MBU5626758.1 PTS sugar transporter subunit IIC [Dysosmobacter acutus]